MVNIRFHKLVMLLLFGCWGMHALGENAVRNLTLDFYGHLLEFDWSSDYYTGRKKFFDELSVERLADFLAHDSNLNRLSEQSAAYARELRLDDLAYVMLVKKTAVKLTSGKDETFRAVFVFTLLNRAGYDVLLGAGENRATAYGHTAFEIRNVLYVTHNGRRYYDLSFDQQKEPAAERTAVVPGTGTGQPIRLNKYIPPGLNRLSAVKTIPFESEGNIYFFTVNINQSLVQYYNDLPDIELGRVYLNYGLSEKGNFTLVQQLKDATAYMSKEKVVNFILDFVQSLDYAKDMDVLGREKFAFPEESVASDYTDCEDRSLLFAYLVREVAHLQSIGLFYRNAAHMNVAVESWRKSGKGDLSVYEMDFVVCEPSGKGLEAGQQTMDLSLAEVIKW